MEVNVTFEDLGLSPSTLAALKAKGFEKPTPIQAETIPELLAGHTDLIAQAQTGTGKTAAFGLPLIEKLQPDAGYVQALILAPTRELALQVTEEINSLQGDKQLRITTIYGGASIGDQIRKLKRGVDIVVGTPGRVIDLMQRKELSISQVSYVVLDEADEMLNMGFLEDVEEILKHTPEGRHMLLFSATMPQRIKTLAKNYMADHKIISVKKEELTTNLTDQIYFEVRNSEKFEALTRIIDIEPEFYGIIFCRTKVSCEEVANGLMGRSYDAEALHGDLTQPARERIMRKFKQQQLRILVATDVAARGIDVDNLSHVINYSLPQDPESYVHRIGRTGRAGNEGTAITFITPSEYRQLKRIREYANSEIRKQKLPEVEDIIALKREKIYHDVVSTVEVQSHEDYQTMADQILAEITPKEAVAALLKIAYKDELDPENYARIGSGGKIRMDTAGTTRLFIAKGKLDNMTPRRIVDFVREHINIRNTMIDNVEVFEQFSFVTLPFREAEELLHIFQENSRGRRPLVEKAQGK